MGCSQSVQVSQGHVKLQPTLQPLVEANYPQSVPSITRISSIQHFNFNNQVKTIKQKILSLPQSKNLVSNYIWKQIFDTFQKLYLNLNQKAELIEFFYEFLQANFQQLTTEQEITFCGDMGKKFMNFQNRIYFKHRYCLQNFFFAINHQNSSMEIKQNHFGDLKMDLSDQQVQKLTGKVRNLCQNDLQSFSFITLYLIHAINKFLESNKSLNEVQNLLEEVLLKLQKLYPATSNTTNVEQEKIQLKNLKKVKIQKNFDMVIFKKDERSNYDQLKDFVIQKAAKASQDKQYFFQLVHKICVKKGYGFKYGLKLKNRTDEGGLFRTIQKVLDQDKYEQAFKQQKEKILKQHSINIQQLQKNKIKQFVQLQKNQVARLISSILDKQTQIQFDAKDLLRAKCLFSKSQQLIEAVQELLQLFSIKNISLIDFKNRLNKKTKDITLVIKLPNSIAQLQLALKFDTTSNQFNHKIYELLRSRIYTPLTNLYVQNEKWSTIFFNDQFEIFHEIVKQQGMQNFDQTITFKQIQNQVIQFKHRFLSNQFMSIAIQNQNTGAKQQSNQIIIKQLLKLNELLDKGYNQNKQNKQNNQKQINRQQNQILFELSFYQKSNKFDQIQKLLSTLQNKPNVQLNNKIILNLKADIFFQKASYSQALQYYKQWIQLNKVQLNTQNSDYAYSLYNAGLCCKYIGYYDDALNYINQVLDLYQQLYGQQSLDYSLALYCLGMIYDDTNENDKALSVYSQCLLIQQQLCGKDSDEVSKTIHNMALIYDKKQQYDEALDSYEKCLKIQQYVLGKQSIECAITLGNMGVVYSSLKQPQKALKAYERSLQIKQKISGRNSIDCAIAINNIAMIYQDEQNYQKALNCYLQSTKIKQNIKGKQDIDVAYSYLNLCTIYSYMKRHSDSLLYAQKSYQIRQNILGNQHPDTILTLQWINYQKSLI